MTSPLGTAVLRNPQMSVKKEDTGRTRTFTKEGSHAETCIHTGKPVEREFPWRIDEKKPALAEEQKKAQETDQRKAPVFQIDEHAFVLE